MMTAKWRSDAESLHIFIATGFSCVPNVLYNTGIALVSRYGIEIHVAATSSQTSSTVWTVRLNLPH